MRRIGEEEKSPRTADHAGREEWKPKGFPNIGAGAHETWHEQRQGEQAGCYTEPAYGVARASGLPPHGRLEGGNQSAVQGPAHWVTRKRQHSEGTLPGGGKTEGEPPARWLAPAGMCEQNAALSVVQKGNSDRTSGQD